MVGTILMFDIDTNEGHISGKDEMIYDFHIGEWLSSRRIKIGETVIFDIEEGEARNIEVEEENILKKHTLHLKINVSLV